METNAISLSSDVRKGGNLMDICLISRFFDLRNGGVGRYSMELGKRLQRKDGVNVESVSQDGGLPLGEGLIGYFSFTSLELPFKLPKADVYHALTPLEAIHASRPLLVTFHDFIPLLYPNRLRPDSLTDKFEGWFTSNYFGMACSIALGKADAITTVSEQTKKKLVEEFGVDEGKIKVIRHGINPKLVPEEKEDDTFRVGTLSFLGPRKRVDLLIEAFKEAEVDGELLIGGDGRERERLEKIAGEDRRIKFLGFVPEDDLNGFFNSLDAFIFPTKMEGYGLPAVEAMACKIPVVTLSDAVIPEDIKNRTITVDNLKKWLKERQYVGVDFEENYKFAKKHDWEECAEKHLGVYENVWDI